MLGVVATLRIKEGKEQEFESGAKEMLALVNSKEPDCLLYTLHKGAEPGIYVFMEQYRSRAALETHGKTDHFKAFSAKVGPLLDSAPDIAYYPGVE